MICQQCKEQGLKSRIYVGSSSTTLLYCPPFYDEDGQLHIHDSNVVTESYSYSNGHSWVSYTGGSCWCGWKSKSVRE